MFPIASGNTRGDPILEAVLTAMLLTVALALFALCGVILRTRNNRDSLHRIERMR
jgi:hypothetical protein